MFSFLPRPSEFTKFTFIFLSVNVLIRTTSGSRLLLILLDGFRWDYLEQDGHMLPGFQSILLQGVQAEYMLPVYPTLSYPNYYSIMTGQFLYFSCLSLLKVFSSICNMQRRLKKDDMRPENVTCLLGGGGCLGMFKDQGNHAPLLFQSYVFAFLKCNVNRNQA